MYWIPKMRKYRYKHRFIGSSSNYFTVPVSILLTKFLTHINALSINNPDLENHLGKIYTVEPEIRDTTESLTSTSFLDSLLSNGSEASAHSFKTFYFAAFKIIFISLYAPITSDWYVMLDFIWTLWVQLRGTRNKWTLQKILSMVGFEPPTSQGLQISSPSLSLLGRQSLDMRLNKCPWNLLSINKLEKVHVYIASPMCRFQPYNVWILFKQ